ncbi:helix-turn-helix domain-containing protein [Streptomyces sp. NPDC050504]|uniref:ArsR/SmtB family transcription factor n=1 Tax=Streptomyces sp. NPDC050504 TaxID=3365618 RepID=UPI0037AA5391
MISFLLGADDLADTRFAISPLQEAMGSLWALSDPGRYPLHAPWRRAVLERLDPRDARVLLALVGPRFALPDFLTPRPTNFAPTLDEELAAVAATGPDVVRRDLRATYAPHPLPALFAAVDAPGDEPVLALRDRLGALLRRYWDLAFAPDWPAMRLVLEADVTHRARSLATGGARRLFDELHPNLRWDRGALHIEQMIGRHRVAADGRGLPLVPSLFAYKPVPPLSPDVPPVLTYPSRGVATLWQAAPEPVPRGALTALLGGPRARLLGLLDEPLPTVELARLLAVTPSAVSQHLRVLYGAGLVTRVRDGRQVLYRRSELGDLLAVDRAGAG